MSYLKAGSHSRLQCLDLISDLNDDTSTFVPCAFRTERRHLRKRPIVQHEVNIAMADAGRIELDQNISRP